MTRALLCLLLALPMIAATAEDSIRKVLTDQVAAWNQGDVKTFMEGYDDSPATTFIGSAITRGYAGVLENYKKRYPTKERMGTLRFSDIEVKMLDANFATVIGRFHLDRTKEAGGESSGIFSLLFQKTPKGWKVIQDHTS